MLSCRSVVVDTSSSPHAQLRPVAIGSVCLEDTFWEPRLRQMREVTLPSQYEILEETGRLWNFRRAAGKVSGDFVGIYFNDSDVYKWVEGCAYALAYHRDTHVEELADRVIAEIADAQRPDGYLNTYFTFDREKERWTNLRDMHELYCAGHLFHAAVAYFRATGKRRLLDVALRLADHVDATFGPDKRPGAPGHPQIEMALVELYRETNEPRYLRLAQYLLDQRGRRVIGGSPYHQDHKPFRELEEVTGHAVRALYLNCGAADLYAETGEGALMEALERMWRNMTQRRMYITGGVGARHEGEAFGGDYELPNERAYAETCAAIANAMWNWRMLLLTGEARFADVLELATYNGALSGIALDGRNYFYVNPLFSRGRHRRQRWFDCACCPTNIVRLLGEVPGMLYTTSEGAVQVHLYAASRASLVVGGAPVTIVQRTAYPWEGAVDLRLEMEGVREFDLSLRIPSWAPSAEVLVNGTSLSGEAKPGTYRTVRRAWKSGDSVHLRLPMAVEVLVAHPHVEASAGRIALKRGPLVYCLEGDDNPHLDPAGVALDVSRIEAVHEPNVLGGVVTLSGVGNAENMSLWEGHLYRRYAETAAATSPVVFKAVPYYAWANRDVATMSVWLRRRD